MVLVYEQILDEPIGSLGLGLGLGLKFFYLFKLRFFESNRIIQNLLKLTRNR